MFDKWEIIKNDLVFSAKPWFDVYKQEVKLPDGKIVNDYYQVEHPDYCEIVAVNPRGLIQVIRHYKHGVRAENLGLPAGYIEAGESALAAAKRELLEECQLQSDEWTKLGEFVLEGNRGQAKAHIFLALNCCEVTIECASDDLEEYHLEWFSMDNCLKHITNGSIAVIGAATAILLAANNLKERGMT